MLHCFAQLLRAGPGIVSELARQDLLRRMLPALNLLRASPERVKAGYTKVASKRVPMRDLVAEVLDLMRSGGGKHVQYVVNDYIRPF